MSTAKEDGIFNGDTGRNFPEEIPKKGGMQDALELFVDFRGREPAVDALLRHSGLVTYME